MNHDVVLIGGSAGGLEVVRAIVAALPKDLPAAIFVLIHTSPSSPGYIPSILNAAQGPRAAFARHNGKIQRGRIYVARPDLHLLLEKDRMVIVRGPKENRSRPAIDPLFRSAAVHYGPRAVGVVLSGGLNDGAAGLRAIKDCGGVAIVQDPREALFPDMPESAIQATPVDHCVPAKAIPALIRELAVTAVKLGKKPGVRKNLLTETKIAALQIQGEEVTDAIGKRSTFTCPECSGALWEMDERKMLRYRCHIGHAYTAESLLADQEDSFERALSAAVRTLEDRARLLGSMAEFAKQKGWRTSSQSFASKAREAKEHSARLRSVLTGTR